VAASDASGCNKTPGHAVEVLRQLGVIITVGLADSLTPSTIGPALYLATGRKRAWRVAQFTVGFFAVNFAGGLVLMIGPGRLLLGLVPHPQGTVRHVIELVAGGILVLAAVALWMGRQQLARRELPGRGGGGGSAVIAGASIAAIEFLTAAPYFAIIAGIVASSTNVAQQLVLLALHNATVALPLLAIIAVLLLAGERADRWLPRAAAWVQRRWPVIVSSLLMSVGGALTVLGGAGLVGQ
jgi:cytochrome c biogenesis protein CcdA